MKKKKKGLLLAAAAVWACSMAATVHAGAQKQQEPVSVEAAFPDENFRAAVSAQADTSGDGVLSREEIESLSELKVTYPYQEGNLHKEYPYHDYDGVRVDVAGIGLFPNLKTVSFENTEPAGLDFEKLAQLETFCIDTAPEMELDFSQAAGLKNIKILNMKLKRLDISGCGVTTIHINDTEFTSPFQGFAGADDLKRVWLTNDRNLEKIDFTPNKKLEWIVISRCGLKKIRLTGLEKLKHMQIQENELENIDVSDNKNLKRLFLDQNRLTKIDVSRNYKLETLVLSGNPFTKIDSKSLKVSDKTPLVYLGAHDLECGVLDVSHISPLKRVYAYSGAFRQVRIGKNLSRMDMVNNKKMTVLDQKTFQAPEGAKLKRLECYMGKLKTLDTRHLKKLVWLEAGRTPLEKADLSGNLKLAYCDLEGTPLKTLAVNKNSSRRQMKMYRKAVKESGGKLVYKE